jgi:hypothetical protein
LIFLQPSEIGFLKHLKDARVPLVEFELPEKKLMNIQSQLEKLINSNYYLNKVRPLTLITMHLTGPERQGRLPKLPQRLRVALAAVRV